MLTHVEEGKKVENKLPLGEENTGPDCKTSII